MFFFSTEEGQGSGSEFYGRRPVPTVPSPLARRPAGVAKWVPREIQQEPAGTRVPHQPEATGLPLSPTTSWWPAGPGGCVKQIATLGQNWQPRRATAGPAQGRRPGGIGRGARNGWCVPQGRQPNKVSQLLFSAEKTPGNHSNKANPKKNHPRMNPPLRA